MKKLMMLGAMIALFGLGTAAALAGTPDTASSQAGQANDQVCPEGDSGKIDVSGSNASLTLTAPEGKLISGYCVKAGSANQGLGPEFYPVDPPAKSVTISHSSGKDISHYSLTFVDEQTTTPTETTPTDTTPTETTPTETTPTETTPAESTPTETTTPESTPTETTSTESTPTETTGTETTPAEPNHSGTTPSTQDSQPVFTPPTSQKPAKAAPVVVASVNASATTPNKAAQAAPFTP